MDTALPLAGVLVGCWVGAIAFLLFAGRTRHRE
jgi:gas vesicle protein